MKRLFSLLLVVSMLLSLTIPAFAEEVVEEILEEVVEEVQEEAIEEEPAEPVTEEVIEEVVEEIAEEAAEEVMEEVVSFSTSADLADSEAAGNTRPAPDEKCPECNDGQTKVKECRVHWGDYTLWMHIPDRDIFFCRGIDMYVGESLDAKLVVGNLEYQESVDSTNSFEVLTIGTDGQPYENPEAVTILLSTVADETPWLDVTIIVNYPGTHLIRYKEVLGENTVYHDVKIVGMNEGQYVFCATRADEKGYYSRESNSIWQEVGQSGDFKFYLRSGKNTCVPVDPQNLFSTADSLEITPMTEGLAATLKLTSKLDGRIGYINPADDRMYWLTAGYDGPDAGQDNEPNLFTTNTDGTDPQYNLELQKGVSAVRKFWYGSKGAAIPALNVNFTDLDKISVDPVEGVPAARKLYSNATSGHVTFQYRDVTCTITLGNQNPSQPPAPSIQSNVKKLFLIADGDPTGNSVHTYWDLQWNPNGQSSFNRLVMFGTAPNNAQPALGLQILSGNSIKLEEGPSGVDYNITVQSEGCTIVGYTDTATGLTYCLPINVTIERNDTNLMARNYVEYNGIKAGIALTNWRGINTLQHFSQIGENYLAGDNTTLSCTLGLLVRDNNGYVNATDASDSRIKDVTFELLGCSAANAVQLGQSAPYQDENQVFTTKAVSVQGAKQTDYEATVAVSYTLDNSLRFTHQIRLWFKKSDLADVEIFATAENLGTAGQLNVVLSSWEAFNAWVKDTQGYEITPGARVKLHLPDVSYDEVVVAQVVSPRNNNNAQPFSVITLWGVDDPKTDTTRTQMCGLIEKGSLSSIGFIDFVAQKKKTMTTTGEEKAFTCGILADYKSPFEPKYDKAYLNKYCAGKKPDLQIPQTLIAQYGKIINTIMDVQQINDCTFTGFDYGVRATPYGHFGDHQHNTYSDNYYGIYMDNDGSDQEKYPGGDLGGEQGNASRAEYTYLKFINNQYAVRIVSIPHDATDYRVRVHDSNFVDNFREFWIDEPGIFYCYRNYFAGKWQENANHHGNWEEYKDKLPVFDEFDEVIFHYYVISEHRPGRVHYDKGDPSEAETLVIINPCRKTPDFEEDTFWFYSGKDQLTVIENGEETAMPISGQAMAELKDQAEISVVQGSESVITYTFQGNGGKKK